MLLSRPAFYSALASCFAHSLAIGFAATLMVAAPRQISRPLKVTLGQRAAPLPIGDGMIAKQTHSAPSEKPPEVIPAPQMQAPPKPKPVAKPKRHRPAPPKIVRTPPPLPTSPSPPPAIALSSEPQATPMQIAAIDRVVAAGAGGEPSRFPGSVHEGGGEKVRTGKRDGGTSADGGREGQPGVVAQPDYGVNPKPPYPMLARRLGAQGIVLLRVQVRADGTVAAVELARSSGFSMLDDSAARTVRESWRFVPARIGDAPTASWVEVPIRFVLEDS